jgi:CRP/FNR family cyclic AMP-dependent transcriptional regulator
MSEAEMESREDIFATRSHQGFRSNKFLARLPDEAQQDLRSIQIPLLYGANVVLFSEKKLPQSLLAVLEGAVRLSIHSTDGRRLSLDIAQAGEVLGLSSVLSGSAHSVTAETLSPSTIAACERGEFLEFLARHPEISQAVSEELSRNVSNVCEQLRTFGLTPNVPQRLARLLLELSSEGPPSVFGGRLRSTLTQAEIGEFIGVSRESVSRTLSAFKSRRLIVFQGSTITIPNRKALALIAFSSA